MVFFKNLFQFILSPESVSSVLLNKEQILLEKAACDSEGELEELPDQFEKNSVFTYNVSCSIDMY